MTGLKTYLPQLVDLLGLSADALYSRQRQLVRLGLIASPAGRGPNSGARATPKNVATLLAAVMVTDNWSDIDERIQTLMAAKVAPACLITGKSTFGAALEYLLANPEQARKVSGLTVYRQHLTATIRWEIALSKDAPDTMFVSSVGRSAKAPWINFLVSAFLNGDALLRIAQSLQEP